MNKFILATILLAAVAVASADSTEEKRRERFRAKLAALNEIEVSPALKKASEHFAGLSESELLKSKVVEYKDSLSDEDRADLIRGAIKYTEAVAELVANNDSDMTREESMEQSAWMISLDNTDPDKAKLQAFDPLINLAFLVVEDIDATEDDLRAYGMYE